MFKKLLIVVVGLALLAVGTVLAMRSKPAVVVGGDGRQTTFTQMAPEELDMRAEHDANRLKHIVAQCIRLEKRIDEDKDLWNRPSDKGLSADERDEALGVFEATL